LAWTGEYLRQSLKNRRYISLNNGNTGHVIGRKSRTCSGMSV
ncbi:10948_t:CDS:1, partial [Funneliformis caledonium]